MFSFQSKSCQKFGFKVKNGQNFDLNVKIQVFRSNFSVFSQKIVKNSDFNVKNGQKFGFNVKIQIFSLKIVQILVKKLSKFWFQGPKWSKIWFKRQNFFSFQSKSYQNFGFKVQNDQKSGLNVKIQVFQSTFFSFQL